ncbi:primosomal protein N' [Glaciihabitans sp. INWT7]|uniref:primosomal protein N' family DNA-binding protein n=1 Tax=Glaciihabitans sp. INWT7 TaxID=2596912 RepID=UPI001625EAB1|nr:primosomal protein N' [Glaciihabitans sp. INWT7]QNE46874.1 primosomal protein N' [Glaciihabitans sp. INWT7]
MDEVPGTTTPRVARVLIDSPLPQLDRLFDYSIPAAMVADAQPGVRVRVPLRSIGRIADGFIVEVTGAGDFAGTLSELEDVVSSARVLSPEVWMLARRLADRAAGNASDIVRLAVPKRQVRVEKAWLLDAHDDADADAVVPLPVPGFDTDRIDLALATGGRLAVDAVPRVVEVRTVGDVAPRWVGHWATTMAASATRALAAGGSAILAVPDYRDQEQLVTALRAVLPADRIVHLDARQSNPDRYRALLACLGDTPLAIVGNRSVLYAPAARLGLMAIWDEGDPLHNEPLSPYVHARDIALVRQELQGSALFFLSHARSTEVERLVEVGWLDELTAVRPVPPKVLPTAQQQSQDRLAAQARIPSSAWREARAALEHGPVLVQVARPGYAPRLACASCGNTARCQRCEGPLRLKTARSTPSCSWCGKLATDWSCANCAGTTFRMVGQGTGRTAEDLGRAFPGVRIIIADGDRPILSVDAEPALVIATRGAEPIAAGGYRAVLLLDGERMVARESLRVGEDCLRWWANAIALAAPGATTVLVGVGGALASALATWRRADYLRSELADRRTLRFPPAVRVATVTGTPETVQAAVGAIQGIDRVDVLGPVETADGGVRAIVRFDYGEGAAVASGLRAEVIRAATSRRKRAGGATGRVALPTLRVRFDDALSFDSPE